MKTTKGLIYVLIFFSSYVIILSLISGYLNGNMLYNLQIGIVVSIIAFMLLLITDIIFNKFF
jgi:hypothetical protein